jgi:hypothetical protein
MIFVRGGDYRDGIFVGGRGLHTWGLRRICGAARFATWANVVE